MRTGGAQLPGGLASRGLCKERPLSQEIRELLSPTLRPELEVIIGEKSWQLLLVAWPGRGLSPGPTRTSWRVQEQGAQDRAKSSHRAMLALYVPHSVPGQDVHG